MTMDDVLFQITAMGVPTGVVAQMALLTPPFPWL
jgi:hypothetical protein